MCVCTRARRACEWVRLQKQVLVLESQEMQSKPLETMQRVYDFLGTAVLAWGYGLSYCGPAFPPTSLGQHGAYCGWGRHYPHSSRRLRACLPPTRSQHVPSRPATPPPLYPRPCRSAHVQLPGNYKPQRDRGTAVANVSAPGRVPVVVGPCHSSAHESTDSTRVPNPHCARAGVNCSAGAD